MDMSQILTALEAAVTAYNPAIGATAVTLINLTRTLTTQYKTNTGKDIKDISQEEWDAMTAGWRTQRDALKQSFKDHPGA